MNYRGDTFIRNYSVETDTGDYTFESGDVLKSAFVTIDGKTKLKKTVNLTAGNKDVDVVWTASEMADLEVGNYILEAEITTASWKKTVQENVEVLRDYIVGE